MARPASKPWLNHEAENISAEGNTSDCLLLPDLRDISPPIIQHDTRPLQERALDAIDGSLLCASSTAASHVRQLLVFAARQTDGYALPCQETRPRCHRLPLVDVPAFY
ncbi:hypothetical protein HPP92_007347 [Vanilla planifolia]|uniref:Uncharacterized protein n=1 Tax=Vanilla planifolia TaxID=51239 RepID=A0A835RK48_VANPL|nr:hypothetical protein HPP92_007347 [Vanilla planifolia]